MDVQEARKRIRKVLDDWPNIGMECDEDELTDALVYVLVGTARSEHKRGFRLAVERAAEYLCGVASRIEERALNLPKGPFQVEAHAEWERARKYRTHAEKILALQPPAEESEG